MAKDEEVFDETFMKRTGRVREWSNAHPRYLAAVIFAALAPSLHVYLGSGTLAKAAVPALFAGLSANSALMGGWVAEAAPLPVRTTTPPRGSSSGSKTKSSPRPKPANYGSLSPLASAFGRLGRSCSCAARSFEPRVALPCILDGIFLTPRRERIRTARPGADTLNAALCHQKK
eukprot:CAMPEP_0174849904 /NCGR_PEP_ID=MMETSP1114-20130205/18081_1 /TAXON_ID=312471 /ORGANISM="Neobodo designis, Strain CCAP 1951/1" /LENGTH=173 /DNA_ID=CAMNT_0016084319 /DNA_START=28 /DNA_END=547 /DNA_ORIENTATION=+